MKRILSVILAALFCCAVSAQPTWTKKASKSLFTLKTFTADGTLVTSSCGFFIGENGEALSSFAPFKGAAKAIVIDAQGKEMNVESILGANSTYDVAKFRVAAKRTMPLAIAQSPATEGADIWLMPYSPKKRPECIPGKVRKVEKFSDSYDYYTIDIKAAGNSVGSPFLNENGEVIGIMQQPADGQDTTHYAVSIQFANSLKTNGLSINDATLKSTMIKKELPGELDQAILTLYVGGSVLSPAAYQDLVEDFIKKFPDAPDGYIYRALAAAADNKFDKAEKDMEQAIKVAEKKDDAHFSYAKLIFQKKLYQDSIPYNNWTLDKAAEEAEEAYRINPVSIYRQLKAQIRFAQKRYGEAFDIYQELTAGELRNAETFFAAARCKEMLKDTTAMLALLDSAVNTFSKPYLKDAAPYLLARAQALLNIHEYRKAVADFNEYEKLMPTQVNANFYYIRAQAETEGHIYQAALNDFKKAIQMEPANTLYHAEKASLEIRVGLIDDAIKTSRESIAIDPKQSEGYLFLGLAQCLKGDKAEGTKNLQKAKELGDEQAQSLIDKYAK